jgi:hypothetical protein
MSADNWAKCPRCQSKHKEAIEDLSKRAREAYGKVSEEEYLRLQKEARVITEEINTFDLREDYEIGMNIEGVFKVKYKASCSTCGYEWKFEHEERILSNE